MLEKVRKKTVQDFDDQWKLQGELNEDYWASDEIQYFPDCRINLTQYAGGVEEYALTEQSLQEFII